MITIRYIYSACVSIMTPDCTILCDPWFTPAYEGAWVQWPRLDKPLDVCGTADYIYLSHVHPDHYDPLFLRDYLAHSPHTKVLIAGQTPPLLEHKLRARGIDPLVLKDLDSLPIGKTELRCLTNHAGGGVPIDSALAVRWRNRSVVNLNDNPYDEVQVAMLRKVCGGAPTVALLPFVGAGPWPQCYLFEKPEEQVAAAMRKAQHYLDLFHRYCVNLEPTVAVPFAGQYWLHGRQLDLNPLRGMADATHCRGLEYGPIGAGCGLWVPEDGGQSTLTIEANGTTWWNGERTQPYDWPTVKDSLLERYGLSTPLRHEQEIQVPPARLPLLKLLQSAARQAAPMFRSVPEFHLYIQTAPLPQWFHLIPGSPDVGECEQPGEAPRTEVYLDARLLFGMLTRLYNANNVRIGSLCRFRDVPATFNRERYDLFGNYWDSLRV